MTDETTAIMPTRLALPLAGAVMGFSRERTFRWAREHRDLITRSPGASQAVLVTTLAALLGRSLTPADIAEGLRRLEARRPCSATEGMP